MQESTPTVAKNRYSADNHASEIELKTFLDQLSVEQLETAMPAGWNVLSVFAHVAFWDIRALILIEKWEKEGIQLSAIDTDVINEVTRPIFLTLNAIKAKNMVIDYAKKIDEKIDNLEPGLMQIIEAEGKNVHFNRAKHRRMHIDEVKKALGLS
jgi:hypothetical protein